MTTTNPQDSTPGKQQETAPVQQQGTTPVKQQDPCRIVARRLAQWLLFGVFFAILPLFLIGTYSMVSSSNSGITSAIGDGALFIASAAICGSALGELVFTSFRSNENLLRVIAGSFCIIICLANSIAFIAAREGDPTTASSSASYILFTLALIISSCSVGLAAIK
jgi:hypothetical protein